MRKLTDSQREIVLSRATKNGAVDAQALIDAVQDLLEKKNSFAWPTIEDYENDVGYKVGMPARIGWDMARTTNSLIEDLAKNSGSQEVDEPEDPDSPAP